MKEYTIDRYDQNTRMPYTVIRNYKDGDLIDSKSFDDKVMFFEREEYIKDLKEKGYIEKC